jgi:hypothetical protein
MSVLRDIKKRWEQGLINVAAFFFEICPYVNKDNVAEICAVVEPDYRYDFIRRVTYEPEYGTVEELHSASAPTPLTDEHRGGLRILREFYGTLQFGDHLFLRQHWLKASLKHADNPAFRKRLSDELKLIEQLLRMHPPKILVEE